MLQVFACAESVLQRNVRFFLHAIVSNVCLDCAVLATDLSQTCSFDSFIESDYVHVMLLALCSAVLCAKCHTLQFFASRSLGC